ncbi:MAG: rhomboid family intramembrane serine protease [Terriglobales bacterium]
MHLIGNMWFLWLAGFVLEDAWGRMLYSTVYLVAGAAALQFYALASPGSMIPTIGASGAVAALMGAFLVRFPKMRIEMAFFFNLRPYRFKAPAYALLPLWLLMEVFSGALFGSSAGVAHWAHVGGFAFGIVAALALRYTGLEHKANQQIEEEISWQADPQITHATDLFDHQQYDEAAEVLKTYLAASPDSTDGWNLLQQVYWRKSAIPEHYDALGRLCAIYVKQRNMDAAWATYEDFLQADGKQFPAATWLELCRFAESSQDLERALAEYEKLAAAYPAERQSVTAQIGAGRVCLKLQRATDALQRFEAAKVSKVPHLDLDDNIEGGIREAKSMLAPPSKAAAQRA